MVIYDGELLYGDIPSREVVVISNILKLISFQKPGSKPLEKILAEGRSNLSGVPRECLRLIGKDAYLGCFELPFLGGRIEHRSRTARFFLGYRESHTCLFFYGEDALFVYVDPQHHWKIGREEVRGISVSLYVGSAILLSIGAKKESLKLKFEESSEASTFVAFLRQLLSSDRTKH